jgi:hypothetical protein
MGYLVVNKRDARNNKTTKTNPTGVKKDEEKTRKKQGEIGKDMRNRNHKRHIDLTGRFKSICTVHR